MPTLEKMNEIFREVFEDDNLVIEPETTANDVEGWDSLSHINLIVALESKFNITFYPKEVLTFKNVGDLLNSIEKKIVK